MLMDIDVVKEGINSLVRAGYYENRDKLFDDAFRTMLEVRPALKTEMAIELYKQGREDIIEQGSRNCWHVHRGV
jgi:Arc/MetJ-type ribon-helix-helix transcriptional regulator